MRFGQPDVHVFFGLEAVPSTCIEQRFLSVVLFTKTYTGVKEKQIYLKETPSKRRWVTCASCSVSLRKKAAIEDDDVGSDVTTDRHDNSEGGHFV